MREERISKLEETVAFQEQKLEELSDVISGQWKEIERLKVKLNKAEGKIEDLALSGDGDVPAADQKPPHY